MKFFFFFLMYTVQVSSDLPTRSWNVLPYPACSVYTLFNFIILFYHFCYNKILKSKATDLAVKFSLINIYTLQ